MFFRFLILLSFVVCGHRGLAEVTAGEFFVGTSVFVLANLDQSDEPPNFGQLNLGYQLSKKDVISLEFITWRYYGPLGVSISEMSKVENKYPGYITGRGAGLAYQRFFWRRFYMAFHATWLDQVLTDTGNNRTADGEQLFLALRTGYRFQFFNGNLFLEPSMAVTHWPVNTGLPPDFKVVEDRWPDFQVEPGLHLGFLF